MKISKLIRMLEAYKNATGDVEVLLSSDEEGNSFGTIVPDSFDCADNCVVIFPFETSDSVEDLI